MMRMHRDLCVTLQRALTECLKASSIRVGVYALALAAGATLLPSRRLEAQDHRTVTTDDVRHIAILALKRLPLCAALDSLSRELKMASRSRWALVRDVATDQTPFLTSVPDDSSFVVLPDSVRITPRCRRLSESILIAAANAHAYLDSGYAVVSLSVVGARPATRSVDIYIMVVPNGVGYGAQMTFRKSRSTWRLVSFAETYDI